MDRHPDPPEITDPDALVTVADCQSAEFAHILVAQLNEIGIESAVQGALARNCYLGGAIYVPILLQVRAGDHARAVEQLSVRRLGSEIRCVSCSYLMTGLDEQSPCPECGSPSPRRRMLFRIVDLPKPSLIQNAGALMGMAVLILVGVAIVYVAVMMVRGYP